MPDVPPVPVVYLAGLGRSGSTLLDRLLGQVAGWWSLGEVVHVWQRGLANNERCGCGEHFRDCPTWESIGAEAYGGWEQVDAQEMIRLQQAVERDRWTAQLLWPSLQPGFAARLSEWHEVLNRLYRGTAAATGANVIVDASKHTSTAIGLRHDVDVDLHLVHLVRDSRGVAHSWAKTVDRPATDGREQMTRWSPLETSLRYTTYNLLLAAAFGSSRTLLHYEDLVATPRDVVVQVVRSVPGDHVAGIPDMERVEGGHVVDLGVSHGVSGNPMRASAGPVTVRMDEDWKNAMPRRQRRFVTAATLPSLIANGYPIRTAGTVG